MICTMRFLPRFSCLTVLIAGALVGQSVAPSAVSAQSSMPAQSIGQPQSGVVYDSTSGSFRPVIGVLGAALLGNPLAIHTPMTHVTTCSPQSFALAASGRRGAVALVQLDNPKLTELPEGVGSAPDQIVLSAGCTSAALFFAAANRLQVITGLPGSPDLKSDFSTGLPGRISSLAVSDDGALVLGTVPGKAVYALSTSAPPVALAPLAQDAAVAFHGNQDALIADQHSNTVLLVSNIAGSASTETLASPEQGVSDPVAVWFDSNKQNVLVANSGNGNLNLIHLPDQTQMVVPCRCRLSELSPLGNETFQVAAASLDQPLLILDAHAAQPRVVFVASQEDQHVRPRH